MRPSRSTAADADDGSYLLDGRAMRATVAVFDDPAYDDWRDLFPLQAQAVAAVEALLGAPIGAKTVVDYYCCRPVDGRLDLSARAIGARSLRAEQFVGLRVVASLADREATVAATLDLSADAPAAVLGADAPLGSLADDVAHPLHVQYEFRPADPLHPLPQPVVEAVALAFRGAFDSRYRGGMPVRDADVEALLAGEGELLGPYD